MVYTDWFPPNILPVREGLYFIKRRSGSDCWHVAYWAGEGWYSAGVLTDGFPKNEGHQLGSEPCYWWLGLTHNAEVQAAAEGGRACKDLLSDDDA